MSIEIPLRSGRGTGEEEFLEIPLDALPDSDELVTVLESERCPLRFWLALAQQYYKQGRFEGFLHILKTCTEPGAEGRYEGTSKELIGCINALAAYYVHQVELFSVFVRMRACACVLV